jgi:cytochrome c biogenesis protein CcmG, thiol:disulfide interchange protein DsbE
MKHPPAATRPDGGVSRLRRLVPVALTALAVAFVAVRFLAATHDTLARTRGGACLALKPDPLPPVLAGGATPDFQLPDTTGHTVSLSAQRGHPVLLNFWATWCPPCVEEMPSLVQLQQKMQGKVTVIAVSMDVDDDAYHHFIKAKNVNLLTVRDGDGKSSTLFGTFKFPETYVIDSKGVIRRKFIGAVNWNDPEIQAYLGGL